jgi:hypothetical protein
MIGIIVVFVILFEIWIWFEWLKFEIENRKLKKRENIPVARLGQFLHLSAHLPTPAQLGRLCACSSVPTGGTHSPSSPRSLVSSPRSLKRGPSLPDLPSPNR